MSVNGLLLLNLGSPRSPETADVGKYLKQFLMDPYVIDLAAPLRFALVHGVIAPFRAAKSAAAYKTIWTENGSPLLEFSRKFASGVQSELGAGWDVRWAMRYGEPSAALALKGLTVRDLYVVPLYPQYAESSTRTGIESALAEVKRQAQVERVFVLQDFFNEAEFIESQALQITQRLTTFRADRVLLSFHGLPEHHLTKLHPEHCFASGNCCERVDARNRNCYRAQAQATARALRARLPLAADKTLVSFQSRLGRRPWIKPYSDLVVRELAAKGVKRLLVSCPSFVADCLETLEEVQIRLKEQFLSEGGEALALVPALNFESHWIKNFVHMLSRSSLEWQTPTLHQDFPPRGADVSAKL